MIIYKTVCLINNKIYIGKDRYNNPSYLGSGVILDKAFKRYGKENFRKEILEFCNSEDHMNEREVYWIAYYNSTDRRVGYNITEGGTGGNTVSLDCFIRKYGEELGSVEYEKYCKVISERGKGNKSRTGMKNSEESNKKRSEWSSNRRHTKETLEKMSRSRKGKPKSEITKQKLSVAHKGKPGSNLGRKFSDEWKQNIRNATLGKKRGPYKKRVTVTNPIN